MWVELEWEESGCRYLIMVQTAALLNIDLGLEIQVSLAYNCSIISMTHTHKINAAWFKLTW